jgi:integrase
MHDKDGDRAGRFFLKQRGRQGIWYICWYNPGTGQADRVSTGTRDREAARTALYEHALTQERPASAADAPLAAVMQSCWLQYARHLPSADTHRAAQRDALEVWGDISVRELDRRRQLEFVAALRARGLSDWTINTRLARVWAMMNWYRRDNTELLVPEPITAADWKPTLEDSDRTFTLDELAALFDACTEIRAASDPIPPAGAYGHAMAVARTALRAHGLTLAYKPLIEAITDQLTTGNMTCDPSLGRYGRTVRRYRPAPLISAGLRGPRYDRDHWRRFRVLAVGTASREAALRELRWDQVVLKDDRDGESCGFIRLNPEGRPQTKKRRATVPICPTLAAELRSWERDSEYVVSYYGRRLASREFFVSLCEAAQVQGTAHVIRHTVRTWLAEIGVPDAEADILMGHKPEGSATGKRYIHRRPGYLKSVAEGIELLFDALNERTGRPFAGRELIDQPDPSDPNEAKYLPSFRKWPNGAL